MKKYSLHILFTLLAALVVLFSARVLAAPPPPQPTPHPQAQAVEQAVLGSVQDNRAKALLTMIYDVKIDYLQFDSEGRTALAWLAAVDRTTKKVIPAEPSIAIANFDSQSGWKVILPSSNEYQAALAKLPATLLTDELQKTLLPESKMDAAATTVFTGYYLPWEGGKAKYLSGSIGHFLIYNSCTIASCRYAYDFYDGTMFELLAAKGGTVWAYNYSCTNGDPNCTNYLTLRDATTSPVTYQLYYHLAKDSIPANLRSVGAPVAQGDVIGNVDDTGYSTGHHLHFHVYADPTSAGSHWGNSVDFIFSDVSVNNGHPRTYYEATTFPSYGTQYMSGDLYVSGNRRNPPPTGNLTAPAAQATLTSPQLTLSGSASDDTGITSLQIVGNVDGTWQPLTSTFTNNPFSKTINLCELGIPDGPFTVGFWAWDTRGARSQESLGARPVYKNYACGSQPPACTPTIDQVSLYSMPDYQGACQVFSLTGGMNGGGVYDTSRLASLGTDKAASIQVGSNVMATLYDLDYDAKGRAETFEASDPGLGDNRSGVGKVSSLHVRPKAAPSAPTLKTPLVNTTRSLNSTDSIILTWNTLETGVEYQAELTFPNGFKATSAWLRSNSWQVGSLPAFTSAYSWKVTARNSRGSATSNTGTFTITSASLSSPSTRSLPYSESFNSGTGDFTLSGIWQRTYASSDTSNYFLVSSLASEGNTYSSGTLATGDLTSPPIALPTGTTSYLRFHSYNLTEGSTPYWDQRWVQISVDNGPFGNLYQMNDDPPDWWVYSPYLDLSAYAGKTIRLRFHFNIIDGYYNAYAGWRVDDITINTTAPDLSCAEAVPNDSPATATPITPGETIDNAYICPAGDIDYYSFQAASGQTVTFDIDAQGQSPASSLDTYIFVLDSDGQSVIAENDDEVSWQVRDSILTTTFHRAGTYYLKVRAWSNPGSGSANHFYRLKTASDNQAPVVNLVYPPATWIPPVAFNLSAQASDVGGGLARVEFYWHSTNWALDNWELIANDTTAADGWKASFNPAGRSIPGSALLVRAYDNAGLSTPQVRWNLVVDNTPPTTRLNSLPASSASTVIPLSWTASDSIADVDYFNIQYQVDGGAWQAWNTSLPGGLRSALFQAQGGHTYGFTIRGVDKAGNIESFASTAEVSTVTPATCSPDGYDASGGDDNPASATSLPLRTFQEHNICVQNDEDWVSFTANSTIPMLILAQSLGGGAAVMVDVTDLDGQVLQTGRSNGLGSGLALKFIPPAAGTYRIRLRPLNSDLWGTSARYSIWVSDAFWLHLPSIFR